MESFTMDTSLTELQKNQVVLLALSCSEKCKVFRTLSLTHRHNWNRKPLTIDNVSSAFDYLEFDNYEEKTKSLQWYKEAFQNGEIPPNIRQLNEFLSHL
jgi:hypothetical protein